MAVTLTGKLSLTLALKEANSADSGLQAAINETKAAFPDWNITSGTASGKADVVFADTRTLAASATEDLDLSGALATLLQTAIFVKVKAVYVYAAIANTNNVQVTRKATTGIPLFMADGDGIALPPGALFLFASPLSGFAVADTTDDTLTFTNSAGTTGVTYTVIIVGCSA